jgi:hypothetical protein
MRWGDQLIFLRSARQFSSPVSPSSSARSDEYPTLTCARVTDATMLLSTASRTRLTRDQLIRQVLQGGGNMPSYGQNLTPAEVTALVAFMQTLRPANQPPARTAIGPDTPGR